mmetsp:Transcript_15266/g.43058  ORF Transcript_15266/g.43058 Transcript_15266/m.43058 type:complete len:81 (+) Transcript_15266:991-1233(+)
MTGRWHGGYTKTRMPVAAWPCNCRKKNSAMLELDRIPIHLARGKECAQRRRRQQERECEEEEIAKEKVKMANASSRRKHK